MHSRALGGDFFSEHLEITLSMEGDGGDAVEGPAGRTPSVETMNSGAVTGRHRRLMQV